MRKIRLVTIVGIIGVAAIVAVSLALTSTKAEASSCCSGHEQKPEMNMKNPVMAETLSLEKIHSEHLPMVLLSIDKAIKAIEAGNKETALAELNKAQAMLAVIKDDISKHVKPKFANIRCPIMGSPINQDKVAENLIRDYKDQKIAFCCGGCPVTWDKLTEAKKESKLAKAKPTVTENHSGYKH